MRLSFMSWVCPTWDLERMAEFTASTAYDGIELRVDSEHAHGLSADSTDRERAAAVELLADHGVELPAVATGDQLAHSDPDERAEQVASAKANAELAGDLGADYLRVFAMGDREEMTEEAAVDAAASLTEIGEFARDHGVTPVLETMHDIVQHPADAYAVIDRVETDNAALLWNRASITDEEFAAVHDDVEHVHMHDEALDPEFDGVADMMARFRDDGYQGYFSLEIIRGEDLPEDLLRETGDRLQQYADGSN